VQTPSATPQTRAPLRLYHARGGVGEDGTGGSPGLYARLERRGFNAVLLPAPWLLAPDGRTRAPLDADTALMEGAQVPITHWYTHTARQLSAHRLGLYVDVILDRCARDAVAATAAPGWYQSRYVDPARDPRLPAEEHSLLHLHEGPLPPGFLAAWTERLARWASHGVEGLVFQAPQRLPAAAWRELGATLRRQRAGLRLLAWTPGLSPDSLAGLRDAGFDAVFSSLPWWDFKSAWLAEEDARLRAIGKVISSPPRSGAARPGIDGKRALWSAAVSGDGLMLNDEDERSLPGIEKVHQWFAESCLQGPLRMLGGRDGGCTALLRDTAQGATAALAINPSDTREAALDWDALAPLLPPADIVPHTPPEGLQAQGHALAPGDCAMLMLEPTEPVRDVARHQRTRADDAANQRIALENISPAVDGGAFPVKSIPHARITVQADIFMDGHDQLAAELRWRAKDESRWRAVPMERGLNDRWEAAFRPRRVGAHEFTIAAWFDAWHTFRHDIELKHQAGRDLSLEVHEGLALLRGALERAQAAAPAGSGAGPVQRALDAFADADLARPVPPTLDQVVALLDPELAEAMRALDDHPFEALSASPYPVWVDRRQACHSSWYELFPRSQAAEPGRHGTFDDVIARLPDVRDMGFDVLYLPPIHPIGQRNRKGRNNSLRAEPDDVGSPYAIGSDSGGHDAIEPQLGTLEDFLRLVDAAGRQGMEIALDFAIQCSPDHPWLTQHPEWFSWRPDGSLRYAENPPKKYEDIVNVAFYGAPARRARKLGLWRALRDVVLFWVRHGVRIFRVDNPHTKPLPFWQWMIGEVHAQHPDVIFLSEAFTRPKMMYRLAKIGFTQSYTYFTWRNEKAELEAYLEEISTPPAADFFRPHFFVNTPDINPFFLQTSGRPGFLIRAALAALGSGLWGMYSGFELCEGAALAGKEEYLDSEKYELRQRDWHGPGNIRAEITRLNQIRNANPALQTHRGLTLAASGNDRVLAFYKSTPGHGNVVLVAISLDPFLPQSARIEAPFWLFGQADAGELTAEDLLTESRETWHEKTRALTLSPDQPYRVWRLSLHG
jgi:starch synthase (maltosyl-transferring)